MTACIIHNNQLTVPKTHSKNLMTVNKYQWLNKNKYIKIN